MIADGNMAALKAEVLKWKIRWATDYLYWCGDCEQSDCAACREAQKILEEAKP